MATKTKKTNLLNGSVEKKIAKSIVARLGKINEDIRALEKEKEELRDELKAVWDTLIGKNEIEQNKKGNYELFTEDGWKCTGLEVARSYPSKKKAEELLTPELIEQIWETKVSITFNIKKTS